MTAQNFEQYLIRLLEKELSSGGDHLGEFQGAKVASMPDLYMDAKRGVRITLVSGEVLKVCINEEEGSGNTAEFVLGEGLVGSSKCVKGVTYEEN